MTPLDVSPRADRDTKEMLARLTELAGSAVAERYLRDLRSIYSRLQMFPASGAPKRKLGRFARIAVLTPYVVVYDYDGEEILIVRLIDGRRNITRSVVRE